MNSYRTEQGYIVVEHNNGLDVFVGDHMVCDIPNKTLSDYETAEGKIDSERLDNEIMELCQS